MDVKLQPLAASRLPLLQKLAAEDGHGVLWPTHEVLSLGEPVGYVSALRIPVCAIWLHSQKVKALESVRVQQALESALRFQGRTNYAMLCTRTSPFFPHLSRLGFRDLGEFSLAEKQL